MRRRGALANNLSWYRRMMDAHGLAYVQDGHVWSTDQRVPPYYSNVITLTAEGGTAQIERIAELAARPPAERWGVADSFACLDESAMHGLGLSLLFEAQWFGSTDASHSPLETPGLQVERVVNADALAAWEQRWQGWSPAPGERVFPPALLAESDVAFWTALENGRPVGGFITHGDSDCLGLSNVFAGSAAGAGAFLRDAGRWALQVAEGRNVVGYGSVDELRALAPLGFEALGAHRVWLYDRAAGH